MPAVKKLADTKIRLRSARKIRKLGWETRPNGGANSQSYTRYDRVRSRSEKMKTFESGHQIAFVNTRACFLHELQDNEISKLSNSTLNLNLTLHMCVHSLFFVLLMGALCRYLPANRTFRRTLAPVSSIKG